MHRFGLSLGLGLWLACGTLWAQSATPTPPPPPLVPPIPASSAPVKLNQVPLLQLQGLGQLTASDRQHLLEERLQTVLEQSQPPFRVDASRQGDDLVLSCQGHYLVTVTSVDAQSENVDLSTLAAKWSSSLEKGLTRTHLENSDEYYKVAIWHCCWALVLVLLLNPLLRRLCLHYFNTTGLSLRGLLWLSLLTYSLHQFPSCRFISLNLQRYALRPIVLLGLVMLGWGLLNWLLRRATRRYFLQTERLQSRKHRHSPRWRQRLHMARDASQFLLSVLLGILAIIIFFSLLDLNLGAFLAGAGFLGVGLGLAAQDVLKDCAAGVNIVVEDQFGTGDVITVGEVTGMVEHFTLRVTQLRDMSGSLITIPNSHIRVVHNLSNLWSQVDLTVPVALDSDLDRAIEVMRQTAAQLRSDRPGQVLDDGEVLGVERITAFAVELRILQKTAPQQQFPVRRELLLRLIAAFRNHGLEIPLQTTRLLPDNSRKSSFHHQA